MANYCYLKHKWQLVMWFCNKYPDKPKSNWLKMSKLCLGGKYKQIMEGGA